MVKRLNSLPETPLPSLPLPIKLDPNPNQFRILHQINTSDEIMSSAYTRYVSFKEVTILASVGHSVSDDVYVYHAKRGADRRNARMFSHLNGARDFENSVRKKIVFENPANLQISREDQLRLFLAFRILIQTPVRDIKGINVLERMKMESVHTIVDICPDAVIVHGRIQLRSGGNRLERFGIAKVLPPK